MIVIGIVLCSALAAITGYWAGYARAERELAIRFVHVEEQIEQRREIRGIRLRAVRVTRGD